VHIRKGTDNHLVQRAQKTKLTKMKKWANELNKAFSKKGVEMAKKKKTHEIILNIPGHKGNAN
jgi:hypothetical protein